MKHPGLHLAILSGFLLLLCLPVRAETVVAGLADLRAWDMKQPVRLTGDYEFFWEAHLQPRELLLNTGLEPVYMPVPGTWNGREVDGRALPADGYATYRVNVLVPDRTVYALKIPDIGTSYELFVDGQSLVRVGEPGRSRETSTPAYYPTEVSFTPTSRRVEIVLHVTNFEYRVGGIWLPLVFGTPAQIEDLVESQRALDLLLFGAIVIIGFYNLALYGMRREDPSSLYLGLFCLVLSVRLLTVGDRYLTRVVDLPFEWFVRLEYLSWMLALSAFAGFMRALIPAEFPRLVAWVMHGTVALGTLVVLLTDIDVFTHVVPPFQLFTIACLLAGSVAFGLAIVRKREGALILTLAYAVLFYAAFNDILVNAGIIDTFLMLDFGLLVFIFFQSMLISYRFTNSFKMIDNQRLSLEAINLRLRTQEKLRAQLEDRSELMARRMLAAEKSEAIETLVGGARAQLDGFIGQATDASGASMMQDLLIIADSGGDTNGPLALNDVVSRLLATSPDEDTPDVEQHLQDGLPAIACSPVRAERLITAMLDFFASHGAVDLEVETTVEVVDDTSLFYSEIDAGTYVVLGCAGRGLGINTQDLELLFDPRAALTRDANRHTGFGMLAAWWIVRELGGGIDLSLPDADSLRLEFYLPIAAR